MFFLILRDSNKISFLCNSKFILFLSIIFIFKIRIFGFKTLEFEANFLVEKHFDKECCC